MAHNITITVAGETYAAELNDSETARAIYDALPIDGSGSRWGEEIYFSIPVQAEADDDARAETEVGALCYWPPGNAFCIFFGPTPASTGSQPCAASPVNDVGRILDDVQPLKSSPNSAPVRIEAT